jgi:ribosome maturation protein SDO1
MRLTYDPEKFQLNTIRATLAGSSYEIVIDPTKALDCRAHFAQTHSIHPSWREAICAWHIYSDVQKGLLASTKQLLHTRDSSGTVEFTHTDDILCYILLHGTIHLTHEYKKQQLVHKTEELAHLLFSQCVDPQTNHPVPIDRIRTALNQLKFKIHEQKSIQEQLVPVLTRLQTLFPIELRSSKQSTTSTLTQIPGKVQQ